MAWAAPGDFLMAAMHANGFASQPTSRGLDDGLRLKDAYIAAAARCAPPDNKPTPDELVRCRPHLQAEWALLSQVSVVVCLGRIAYDVCWQILDTCRMFVCREPRPPFAHGQVVSIPGGPSMIAAYHPSRQNTNTGRLTPEMLASVFRSAALLDLLSIARTAPAQRQDQPHFRLHLQQRRQSPRRRESDCPP